MERQTKTTGKAHSFKTLQAAALACRGCFTGTAILCEDRCISYEDFDSMTDRIAAKLLEKGYVPGEIAAMRMRRTEKMILVLFGIIKSGMGVLPLTLDLPEGRLHDIFAATHPAVMVTDDVADQLLTGTDLHDPTEFMPVAKPEDTALLFFTSGSTGSPKGVRYRQSAEALNAWAFPEGLLSTGIPCRAFDTVLAKTNVSFVSSYLFEYFTALFCGRTLTLLTDTERNDYACIGRLIAAHPNSSLFLTPSELGSYLREAPFREQLQGLAVLILAGEMVSQTIRESLQASAAPATTLISLYGSTECHAIAWSNLRDWDRQGGIPPEGVRVEVVDETGLPLPHGQVGVAYGHLHLLGLLGLRAAGGHHGAAGCTSDHDKGF